MRQKINSWLKHPMALAIVPALLGLGYFAPKPSPIKKLEFMLSNSNDFIQSLSSNADRLKMKYEGKTISQISQTDVQIFNRTGESHTDVELTFELQPDSSGKIPTLVNSPNLVGPGNYDNSKIQLEGKSNSKFTYKIHVVNTSANWADEFNKYFKISFIVIGKTAPEVKIKMAEKGLDIKKYDTNPLTFTLFNNFLYCTVVCCIFYVLLVIFARKRANKRFADQAVDKLRELSQGENASLHLDSTQIPAIVEIVLNPKMKKNAKDESRASTEST